MARFNTSLPPKFPHNLDMEDAYSLLCEKNELYEKYLQNGDEASANAMCEMCVEIANHYSLMFVPHIDNTYTPPIPTEQLLKGHSLLLQYIAQYLEARNVGIKAYNKCLEIAKQYNLEVDFNDMDAAYAASKNNINMIEAWYPSGCGDGPENDNVDFNDYIEEIAGPHLTNNDELLFNPFEGLTDCRNDSQWYGSNCSVG